MADETPKVERMTANSGKSEKLSGGGGSLAEARMTAETRPGIVDFTKSGSGQAIAQAHSSATASAAPAAGTTPAPAGSQQAPASTDAKKD
jgi:hypothetical protein